MSTFSTIENGIDYLVENNAQKRPLKIAQIRTALQLYLSDYLSIETDISLHSKPGKRSSDGKQTICEIRLIDNNDNKPNTQELLISSTKKFLQDIQSKEYLRSSKVFNWIISYNMEKEKLKFLHALVNKKVKDMITIFDLERDKLYMHYFPKKSSTNADPEKLINFIENEIVQEIIPQPLSHEQSIQLDNELEKFTSPEKEDDEVLIVSSSQSLYSRNQEIVIFGYERKVNEIKKQILKIIENNIVITYKLESIDRFQIDNLLENHSDELEEIESKYADVGVDLRLRANEFSAPKHLKDEIESSIQKLVTEPSTTTIEFDTIEFFALAAKKEEQRVKSIAQRHWCSIKTKLQHNYQSYPVPKASTENSHISKSTLKQSTEFCSSPDVFRKMIVANGSIEFRTGDIALQKVDTIIIPTTNNGLKEGVIDRLGEINYEKTYFDIDGTMYTETNGGKLNCKRVLFSNWLPPLLINNDDALKLSIKKFVTNSIEYALKENDTSSVAFAAPDSSSNERVVAEAMVAEAKREIQERNLSLKILFVCLPEQQTLNEQFSNFIQPIENVHVYMDWPTAIIKITLLGYTEFSEKCQKEINKYLSRCVSKVKVMLPNAIFQSWDQASINSFYKYCKDRCILLKFTEINNEIELIGPPPSIPETKKKLYILSELMVEKRSFAATLERPSSATIRNSARSENISNLSTVKLYNIIISYSQNDARKCRRLINRLTEEGFSIGTNSNTVEEKHDLCSKMHRSDCIILCISENYYENLSCIEEAKYAFQTDKKIYLVKVQSSPILGWNNDLFDGKLYFSTFGSENYFNLEYERLLVDLLRHTKPGFTSVLQRRSSYVQQNVSIVSQQVQIENNSMTKASKIKNQKASKSLKRALSFLEECWLERLSNISKPNVSFFASKTRYNYYGDSNNNNQLSVYMPVNSYKVSDLYIHSTLSVRSSRLGIGGSFYTDGIRTQSDRSRVQSSAVQIWENEHQSYGICTEKIQLFNGLSQVFPTESTAEDFIPRKQEECRYYPYLGIGTVSEEEMKKRREFDDPEKMKDKRMKLAEYFLKAYKKYSKEDLDAYLTFAQRMKNNATEFERFCVEYQPKK